MQDEREYDVVVVNWPRQQVAFLEKVRKIKGCGVWQRIFIPNLSQKIKDLGL